MPQFCRLRRTGVFGSLRDALPMDLSLVLPRLCFILGRMRVDLLHVLFRCVLLLMAILTASYVFFVPLSLLAFA